MCRMPCMTPRPPWYSRGMRRAVLALLLLFALTPVMAQSPEEDSVVRIDLMVRDGRLYVDADIIFTPSDEWRHAMERGLPAYFTADLELVSPRWWWFDKTVVSTHKTWKVAYNALTQQWRIGSGDLALPAPSLDAALTQVRHIRDWDVVSVAELGMDTRLSGRLRLRLDTSLLAQPLQINALNGSGWNRATPWKNFNFSVITGPSDPS